MKPALAASAEYSSVSVFAKQSGSSVLTVQFTPARMSERSGCEAMSGKTPRPTLLSGQTANVAPVGGKPNHGGVLGRAHAVLHAPNAESGSPP